MAVNSTVRPAARLSESTLRDMYWTMLLARRLDERAWALHRQGRIAFHISGIGQEAAQVAAAFAINRGVDFVAPYYRDLALLLALGMPTTDFMLSLFGKHDISSGGRQMPFHWSFKHLNVVSGSAVVTTQVPQAAGLAFAVKYRQQTGMVDPQDTTQPRLALTCLGEGSTSQGEWHEAMNWAGVHKLPMICFVQNNMYAISEKPHQQMAVANVADRASAYGVAGAVVDGNDVLAVYDAMVEAVERAYNGDGATLLEAKMYRLTPHSSDDDDRTYRSREEIELWKARDGIPRFRQHLIDVGVLTEAEAGDYDARARAETDRAQQEADAAPMPAPEETLGDLYAKGELD